MEKFFISRQSWHFDFDVVIYKVLFPICTLTFRQVKGINKRDESTEKQILVNSL